MRKTNQSLLGSCQVTLSKVTDNDFTANSQKDDLKNLELTLN